MEKKPKKSKKSKGLGDTISKITEITGIKAVVDFIADATDSDCGCEKRRDKLNALFPYKGEDTDEEIVRNGKRIKLFS